MVFDCYMNPFIYTVQKTRQICPTWFSRIGHNLGLPWRLNLEPHSPRLGNLDNMVRPVLKVTRGACLTATAQVDKPFAGV